MQEILMEFPIEKLEQILGDLEETKGTCGGIVICFVAHMYSTTVQLPQKQRSRSSILSEFD